MDLYDKCVEAWQNATSFEHSYDGVWAIINCVLDYTEKEKLKGEWCCRVVDSGEVYSTYKEWAVEYQLTNWRGSVHYPFNREDVYTILCKGPHLANEEFHGVLYGIQAPDGTQHIIGEQGIVII